MPPRRRGAHATDGEDAIECNQLNQLQQQMHLQMQQQLDKSGQDNEIEGWTTVGKRKSRGKMINQQTGNSQSGNKEVVVEDLIDGSFSPFVDEEIADDSFDSIWRMIEKRNEVNCDMGYVEVDRAPGRNMEDDDFVDDIGKDHADRYARKVFDEMGERDIVSWNSVLELEKAYPAGIVYSTGSQVRGQETTVLTAITQLVHHRLIFVPIGYSFGAGMFEMEIVKGGSPNGARTIAGDGSRQPTTLELEKAFHQGKYIAAITKKCQGISQEVNLCHSFIGLRLLVYDDRQILVDMMRSYFTRDTILKYCDVSVHGSVYINGFESNVFVGKVVVAVYNRWGTLKGTRKMFDEMTMRSVYDVMSWNSIIPDAVRNGEYWVALNLFWRMCRESVLPNSFTFSSVFTACSVLEELETGKTVQGWVIKCRADDAFVCTAIVDLYAKYGDMEEAVKEFLCMPERNVVSWTAIIFDFVQKDDSTTTLAFFKVMRNESVGINSFTLTSVITACAKPNMITEAMQIHSLVLKSFFFMYPVIGSALLNFSLKLRDIDLSEMVFGEVGYVKTPGILAAMISSSAQNQNSKRTIELYQRMLRDGLRPDTFCSSSVLRVIDRLEFGKQLHGYILKAGLLFDVLASSSLFTMYSKCGSLYDSFEVFKQISGRDNVSWASMIAGFTEHGYVNHVVQLFRGMLSEETRPDLMTLTSILTTCSVLQSLYKGKEIHGYALRAGFGKEILVGGALVNMFAKCGALGLTRNGFAMLPVKDQISCSVLVSGYAQNGQLEDAVLLFHNILMSGFSLDSFTLSSVLGAVSLLNRPILGTQLHALATEMGLESDLSVGSSLITMYSKSGSMENCRKAFDRINKPDLLSWSGPIEDTAGFRFQSDIDVQSNVDLDNSKPESERGVLFMG